MEVTPVGIPIIILGVILFFWKKEYLFYAFVFSIPFIATAVINIPKITFGLQPSYFFLILLLLKALITGEVRYYPTLASVTFLIYILFATLSLTMPFVIDGSISATNPEGIVSPIEPSRLQLTQYFYVIFFALTFLMISNFMSNPSFLKKSVKIYLLSAFFVSLWGVYQLISGYFGLPYLLLFNNSLSNAQGWFQYKALRISSVAPEPSMFANFLLSVIPIAFFFGYWHLCFFLIVILLLTRATTAYLGFAILVLCIIFNLRRLYQFEKKRNIILALALVGIAVVIVQLLYKYISKYGFVDYFATSIYEKVILRQHLSGQNRFRLFVEGMELFIKYPLLGVGIGSFRSGDWISTTLAKVGITGFISFSLFIFLLLKEGLRNYHLTELKRSSIAFSVSLIAVFLTMCVSVSDLMYMHFWFITGTLNALGIMRSSKALPRRG